MPITQIVEAGLDKRTFWLRDRDCLFSRGDGNVLDEGSGDDLLNSGAGPGPMSGRAGNEICRVDNPGNFISGEPYPGGDAAGMNYVVSAKGCGLGFYSEKLGLTGTAVLRSAARWLSDRGG